MMRTGTYIAFTLGFLLIGLLLIKMDRERTRAQALLQQRADSLDTALGTLADRWKERERADTALRDSVRVWRQRAASTGHQTDTLVTTVLVADTAFRSRLADSLKAGFDSLRADHAAIVRGFRLERDDLLASIVGLEGRLSLKDTSMVECKAGLAAAIAQRNDALKMAHPGLLTRIVRGAPTAIVAAAVGFALH